MNNSRSIARLQIPAQSLPSTPSTIRRPSNLDPITWSRNPDLLLRRPSNESSTDLPHDPSSLSNLGWGQHLILPPANNTSFVTVTQGYPSPQISPGQQYSPERIGGFPFRYQQTIDRTQSNDSGSGTGCSSADSKDYHHHHGSILKGRKNGSSTVGTIRRSLSRDAEPRRVVFKNSVSVYWYDSDAESVCSPTEYERFNIEPAADDHRSRYSDGHGGQGSLMISDGESGLHRRGGVQRGSSKKRLQETGNARNFPDCTTPRAPPGSPVAQCKQATLPQLVGVPDKRTPFRGTPRCSTSPRSAAQLSLVQDQVTLRRKLVVAVQLSPELHPYDVLVKANKNGNKIRVVISRNASLGVGSMGYNGANEHIPLPVEIDPYQLNARLDRDGILHIEAPVIS